MKYSSTEITSGKGPPSINLFLSPTGLSPWLLSSLFPRRASFTFRSVPAFPCGDLVAHVQAFEAAFPTFRSRLLGFFGRPPICYPSLGFLSVSFLPLSFRRVKIVDVLFLIRLPLLRRLCCSFVLVGNGEFFVFFQVQLIPALLQEHLSPLFGASIFVMVFSSAGEGWRGPFQFDSPSRITGQIPRGSWSAAGVILLSVLGVKYFSSSLGKMPILLMSSRILFLAARGDPRRPSSLGLPGPFRRLRPECRNGSDGDLHSKPPSKWPRPPFPLPSLSFTSLRIIHMSVDKPVDKFVESPHNRSEKPQNLRIVQFLIDSLYNKISMI